jgi:hypothetical protein
MTATYQGGQMERTAVLGAGFLFDDLHIEELEPRLEFVTYSCIEANNAAGCSGCQMFGDGDGDFAPLLDEWACG